MNATPPALTFQKVAPLLPDSEWPSLSKEQAEAEWTKVTPSVSAWQQLLRETPEASWKAWSSAANAFLLQTGKTCATPGTRERGTMPKLINAGARVAPGQPLRERQLRRLIRRLDEIRHLEIEQYPLPPDLVRACVRGCSTWDLQQQAELHQWGCMSGHLAPQAARDTSSISPNGNCDLDC